MYIFLSQFRKADKLVPVITLVFYYHPDAWDGSLDLHGILRQNAKKHGRAAIGG